MKMISKILSLNFEVVLVFNKDLFMPKIEERQKIETPTNIQQIYYSMFIDQ